MAGMSSKRLQKELAKIQGTLPPGISLVSASDLKTWEMDIRVLDNPLYHPEENYRLRFSFSTSYPIEAPEVVFVQLASPHRRIPMHPHIYSNGIICLDLLDSQGWSPVHNVESICISIQSMLASNTKDERPPGDAEFVRSNRSRPRDISFLYHDPHKALAHLRGFTSQPTNWYKCPLTRRAAVLILLYADRGGDLKVVLTIRSAGLKNYAGQAALPGGKSDTLQETPFMTARREAFEEIGLPMSDQNLPPGYTVEHLTELPSNLAMTELGVRPCVAYLKTPPPSDRNKNPDAARDILPKLDAREVAAVFTAPFQNFLREKDIDPEARENVPGEWYRGSWHSWHETAWRMHQFFVPVTRSTVFLAKRPTSYTDPRPPKARNTTTGAKSSGSSSPQSSLQPPLPKAFYKPDSQDPLQQPRYRVFGMTARILVDAATVAYGDEPEFEHNSHFGDEDMIAKLLAIGRLSEERKEGEVLTREVMQKAKVARTGGPKI
ncbi:hypothetical protein M409DRAFT_25560 [Zasmidium cellare ATCC 36951]|uniref:UBC core domain-containing protein n=1 Tax=Zasmidium cellare ATCC 36951 TaxID=1080233 RepID=A0A6A6CDG5_ZASCE|nr:uncharacterized protein M409DRAFT_25560 [Zasmidium cellare ATCC 36951]KAF2164218.1 hypothetical protein M409DRAFT_25560 [Zasmidium cellare ATCC 36951]